MPSDTDFKIFRDFGKIPGSKRCLIHVQTLIFSMIYSWKTFHLRFLGLDLAYFKNGYVYHTKYDDIQHVSLSSVQRAGDNLLALVSNLAMSDWPSVRDSSDIVIFFDYLGLFMITFSNLSWHLLNITLISLAFYQSINWVTIQDGNLHWTWSITNDFQIRFSPIPNAILIFDFYSCSWFSVWSNRHRVQTSRF